MTLIPRVLPLVLFAQAVPACGEEACDPAIATGDEPSTGTAASTGALPATGTDEGTGGATSTDPDPTSAGMDTGVAPVQCPTDPGLQRPAALLDDFEDGDGGLIEADQRNGSWFLSTDDTNGTITPMRGAIPSAEPILGGRCGSQFAMRMTGEGFTDWGVVLSGALRFDGDLQSVDFTRYEGVRLWARVGELHSSALRVQLQDVNTLPQGEACLSEDGGEDGCYNGWGTQVVPLGTQWLQYEIPFDTLAQRDFGYRTEAFDPSQVYSIEFTLDANSVFDLWIDDISLY